MDLGMKDKVAAITGGSAGIGLAVAEGLAQEGVHLGLCARNEAGLTQQARELSRKYGVKAIGVKADVTKPDDVASFAAAIEAEYDGVDILINNAGTGSEETIMQAPDERWQHYWELHVMAAVRLSRSLVPLMRKRGGGVILNNASICATQPIGFEPIYNVTKAALVMFSKCLANELIPDNIRVNAVNPGMILTSAWEIWAKALTADQDITWEECLENYAKEHAPIGRFASPEEVARFFVFLCSPQASYCVGSTYYVDGGWLNVIT